MSAGGHESYSFLPTMESRSCNAGNIRAASQTLRVFDEEGDTFRYARDNLTDLQLEGS